MEQFFNKYNFKHNFVWHRENIILDYCKDKTVLHIGPCDWPFTEEKYSNGTLLHTKIMEVSKKVYGVDLDQNSIDFLKSKGINDIYNADINNVIEFKKIFNDVKFDVIIFGEVIEHLVNPGQTIENIMRVMDDDTLLLISTPNATSLLGLKNSLLTSERIHEDHKISFSMGSLIQFAKHYNLDVVDYYFTFLSRPSFFTKLFTLIGKIFPFFGNTICIICKKNEGK